MKPFPFIFKSPKMRNIREFPDIPLCVEMHKSMWIDEFGKYSCKDLCGEGILYENPDILETAPDSIKDRIRRGNYIIHPMPASHFKEKNLGLSDYIYVSDNKDGKMQIHWESDGSYTPVEKTSYTGKRFLK